MKNNKGFKRWLENQVAGSGADSLAVKMRMRRIEEFEQFFEHCFEDKVKKGEKVSILDVGGTYSYWNSVQFKYVDACSITLLNKGGELLAETENEVFYSVEGDATDLSEYKDKSFDLCFSNSVIEHVGDNNKQMEMAKEMRRVGQHFYLQTPNFWFPFEPHYRLPFVQFFPVKLRAWFGLKWKMGYFEGVRSKDEAIETAKLISLLKKSELKILFPNETIRSEKVCGLVKSFYLYS